MTVFPCLKISSRDLLRFYQEAFGLRLVAVFPPEGEEVDHAQLRLGDGAIMCGTRGATEQPLGATLTYWVLPDAAAVDALYARAIAAGATSVREPYVPDYGGRECGLADPDGNGWSFGTYAGEPG
ncbi:glyoxalase [Conexibacter sp. W3-3-2]|uniref:Glyoxalase n=1 Tax=Paraconexibacter algicola TaxID=2133960 RepID=A0A2T4UHQ1_9ACTN|nr:MULTISPECIES: VOC family protein [Solirubrobacterales]MTD45076.1 glyoxalase [Conexibacter sp. W3-3-2]PTL58772.1 glyoxalase [Paraconexibacter algicola]